MKTPNPNHPVRNTLRHLALNFEIAEGGRGVTIKEFTLTLAK